MNWQERSGNVMRIAIVGSRSLTYAEQWVKDWVRDYVTERDIIVSGGAIGVDSFAFNAARQYGIPITVYFPNYAKYTKAAPFVRNKLIVDNADSVVAFWDGKSKGTLHTIREAQKQKKELTVLHVSQTGVNEIDVG